MGLRDIFKALVQNEEENDEVITEKLKELESIQSSLGETDYTSNIKKEKESNISITKKQKTKSIQKNKSKEDSIGIEER